MDLYLAADSGRLQQAMTCTAQLAHMSYRLGSDGTLLASPLPDTLRGGLLMLSDEGGAYPEAPEGLCCRLLQECLHRRYAGVILDAFSARPQAVFAGKSGAVRPPWHSGDLHGLHLRQSGG